MKNYFVVVSYDNNYEFYTIVAANIKEADAIANNLIVQLDCNTSGRYYEFHGISEL